MLLDNFKQLQVAVMLPECLRSTSTRETHDDPWGTVFHKVPSLAEDAWSWKATLTHARRICDSIRKIMARSLGQSSGAFTYK